MASTKATRRAPAESKPGPGSRAWGAGGRRRPPWAPLPHQPPPHTHTHRLETKGKVKETSTQMLEYADVRSVCVQTHKSATPLSSPTLTHSHLSSTGAQGDVQAESPSSILPSLPLSPRCRQNTESVSEASSLQSHAHANAFF